jgi:GDSL-like Lipase/Acylhydrolase family
MSRERLFTGLVVAATAVLIALALETFVRLAVDDGMQFDLEMWKYAREVKRVSADPRIGHEHRPGATAHLMGVDVATNSHKFRDREIRFERTADTLRIMMLGDSLTFGWGVPNDKTFVKRLEALIGATGVQAEVINAGVGNYNTSMEVAAYLAEGHRFRPDIVVLNYFINDAEQTPRYDTHWLERNSAAYVYFASRIDVAMRMLGLGSRRPWDDYLKNLYDPSSPASGWTEVEAAVALLAEFCRARGTMVLVTNLPELRQLKPYPFDRERMMVRALADRLDLLYLDLLPAVDDLEPSRLWVTPMDPHPNSLADERFAAAIFDFLRAWDLLRTPNRGN